MDPIGFLVAYFSDWLGWMSGLFSVALAIWGFVRPKSDPKRGFIIAAAGVALLIAPIHIWTIEHRARLFAEESLASRLPKLSLHIVEAATGMVNNQVFLLLTVRIRNMGTPSVADTWEIHLISADGQSCRFLKRLIPPNGINLGTKHISASDAIYDKVVSNPIPEGGQQVGVILYQVDGISNANLASESNSLRLSVRDVTGKLVISDSFKGERIGLQYYPGMSHP